MPRMQEIIDSVHAARGRTGNQQSSCYLPADMFRSHADLDGFEARRFFERNGYEVATNVNLGTNGLAVTSCGWRLSTNGHLSWQSPVA